MDFWFEFLDIFMNEKEITCHDTNGFEWKNINIYPILTILLYGLTSFLAHCIVIAPHSTLVSNPLNANVFFL
jgi:hypothetical protein